MRGKNLCVHGEDAKRIWAYSPNTPKDIKVYISRLIIIQILNFFGFFLSKLYGMDKAKKPSHATVPLDVRLLNNSCNVSFPCYFLVKTFQKKV
jgi:hypothetical protein